MRSIVAIFRREVLSFFVSPVAYFVITGFVLLAGYFFFNLLGSFNAWLMNSQAMAQFGQSQEVPSINQVAVEGLYQTLMVILVFLIPLLTMRTIAEERRRGTFELLITSPVSVSDIVWGKFLGVGFVVLLMLLFVLCFPLLLLAFATPEVWPIFVGFLGLLLSALAFTSIGMAASSFSDNQIVAGVSSMVALLLLYVIHAPAESLGGSAGEVFTYLSPVMQSRDMMRGVISVQSLVYFVSLIGLGLFVSMRALDAHRWR